MRGRQPQQQKTHKKSNKFEEENPKKKNVKEYKQISGDYKEILCDCI